MCLWFHCAQRYFGFSRHLGMLDQGAHRHTTSHIFFMTKGMNIGIQEHRSRVRTLTQRPLPDWWRKSAGVQFSLFFSNWGAYETALMSTFICVDVYIALLYYRISMKSDTVPPKCGPKTPSSSMLHGSNLCFFFSLWTGRYVVLSSDKCRNLKGIVSNNDLKEYIFMKYFRINVTPRPPRSRYTWSVA